MPKQWNRTSQNLLPPEKRVVLLNIEGTETGSLPPCVVAGYMKRSAASFYFVTPGADVQKDREVMYWSDCLGDDFQCPLWPHKTMNAQ